MKLDRNFLRYSALDSACTLEIKHNFWDELKDFRRAYDLTVDLFPVLMFMQTRGVKVSHRLLEETKVDVLKAAAEKQHELNELCGEDLNVKSPKQCQDYFYGKLGITPYLNKEGRPTVDDLALQRLVRGTAARPGLRQAKLVQEIRGLHKLYGTYLDIEFDSDGRLRGSYNPRGTKFGRLSSSKTVFGTGTNFQNLPQEFKKFLVADDDYFFMEVDKRQAEWVVVAYETGDANMISAIEKGIDVHLHTASLMFGVDTDLIKRENKLVGHSTDGDYIRELRNNDEVLGGVTRTGWPRAMSLRQCGKKSNHGLNYDEGYRGFALIHEIEEAEAKRIVAMYHRIYPGIKIWYEAVRRELQQTRTLTNCFGRSVRFMGAWNDDLFKSAYSMLPQSTVVDSLNQGMLAIYEDAGLCSTKGLNIDILAQVHDSVLMQIPKRHLLNKETFDQIIGSVTEYTSPELSSGARKYKIASDFKVGMNWGEAHEERNPLGMADVHSHDDFLKILEGWKQHESRAG